MISRGHITVMGIVVFLMLFGESFGEGLPFDVKLPQDFLTSDPYKDNFHLDTPIVIAGEDVHTAGNIRTGGLGFRPHIRHPGRPLSFSESNHDFFGIPHDIIRTKKDDISSDSLLQALLQPGHSHDPHAGSRPKPNNHHGIPSISVGGPSFQVDLPPVHSPEAHLRPRPAHPHPFGSPSSSVHHGILPVSLDIPTSSVQSNILHSGLGFPSSGHGKEPFFFDDAGVHDEDFFHNHEFNPVHDVGPIPHHDGFPGDPVPPFRYDLDPYFDDFPVFGYFDFLPDVDDIH